MNSLKIYRNTKTYSLEYKMYKQQNKTQKFKQSISMNQQSYSIQPINSVYNESSGATIYKPHYHQKQQPQPQKKQQQLLANIQNGFEVKFYYNKMIKLDQILLLLCVINFLLTILYTDSDYYEADPVSVNLCLILLFGFMTFSICIIFFKHLAQVQLLISRFQLSKHDSLWSSGRIPILIFDIIIISIQPYPFLNGISIWTLNIRDNYPFLFKLNYILALGCFFKIFMVARILLDRSKYMTPRSVRVSNMYEAQNGYLYAIKGLFMDSPMMLIGVSFIVSIFYFTIAMRICERNLNKFDKIHGVNYVMDLQDISNVLWFTIITMTTVGYGDFYPRTLIGRIVDVFLIVWGSVIVSLIIVVLTNSLTMDMSERRALTVLNRLDLKSSQKERAASYIANSWRRRQQQNKLKSLRLPKQQKKSKGRIDDFSYMLDNNSKEIHQIKKQMQAMLQFDDLYEQLTRQFDSFMDEVDQFINTQIKVEEDLCKFINNK